MSAHDGLRLGLTETRRVRDDHLGSCLVEGLALAEYALKGVDLVAGQQRYPTGPYVKDLLATPNPEGALDHITNLVLARIEPSWAVVKSVRVASSGWPGAPIAQALVERRRD